MEELKNEIEKKVKKDKGLLELTKSGLGAVKGGLS